MRAAPRRWKEHFSSVLSITTCAQDMVDPCIRRHVEKGMVVDMPCWRRSCAREKTSSRRAFRRTGDKRWTSDTRKWEPDQSSIFEEHIEDRTQDLSLELLHFDHPKYNESSTWRMLKWVEKLMWNVLLTFAAVLHDWSETAEICTARGVPMRQVQEGTKSNTCSHMWILTGLEVWIAAARHVKLHGRRALDVGILFGPHLVEAQLHGAQREAEWAAGFERNMRNCRVVTTVELRFATV